MNLSNTVWPKNGGSTPPEAIPGSPFAIGG